MNDLQSIIDRQLGIYYKTNYDNILKRLIVEPVDSYRGVQSSLLASDYNPEPPIFACRFAETAGYEHVLALANEDGRVAIQDTAITNNNHDNNIPFEGFQCHNNAVFDLAWMPGQMKFVTVSGDHSACLWDIVENLPTKVQAFSSHTRSVKTAVFRPSDPSTFATGARDGHILVWDIRSNSTVPVICKPDNCILNCHSTYAPKTCTFFPISGKKRPSRFMDNVRATSITGLVFQDNFTLISCGECDGSIKVWDLRKNYSTYKKDPLPKHSIPYCGSSTRNGYTNLIVDSARVRLYASCMDNVIYCFNISTYSILPEQRFVGHENGTFYIKTSLSPDCNYLVSGSSDKNAYIWNVKYSEPVVKLDGHSAEVTCAAWCQKGHTKIVTCSDDARHKIWRIGKEFIEKDEEIGLRGRAEVVPRSEKTSLTRWGNLEKTPKSAKKRTPTITPSSYSAKRFCRRNSNSSPDASSTTRRTKRCLTDMMNASKLDYHEEQENAKKFRQDLPTIKERNENQDPQSSNPDKRTLEQDSDILISNKIPKLWTEDMGLSPLNAPSTSATEWVYKSPKKIGSGESFITPTKFYEKRSPKLLSPKQLSCSVSNRYSSPTMNLPNFVMDGEAPHLKLMSPVKKKQETVNWLQMITQEKKSKLSNDTVNSIASELVGTITSPKAESIATRRNSSNIDKTPKRRSHHVTLLKYFNIVPTKEK